VPVRNHRSGHCLVADTAPKRTQPRSGHSPEADTAPKRTLPRSGHCPEAATHMNSQRRVRPAGAWTRRALAGQICRYAGAGPLTRIAEFSSVATCCRFLFPEDFEFLEKLSWRVASGPGVANLGNELRRNVGTVGQGQQPRDGQCAELVGNRDFAAAQQAVCLRPAALSRRVILCLSSTLSARRRDALPRTSALAGRSRWCRVVTSTAAAGAISDYCSQNWQLNHFVRPWRPASIDSGECTECHFPVMAILCPDSRPGARKIPDRN
jgi:hypothetical protein